MIYVLILISVLLFSMPRIIRSFKTPVFDDVYLFEDFVCNDLFEEKQYEVKQLLDNPAETITEEHLYPDFRFVQISTRFDFYIKTKYVAIKTPDKFDWCKRDQFLHFKFLNNIPLYIVIGIGGTAANPENIYMIPYTKLTSNEISLSDWDTYQITDTDSIHF